MVEVSFLAAFLGGVLSLLSPCSALLLPAFFAYAFTSRTQLLGRTLLFLAGLCSVFVPLGLGASFVAALLIDFRGTTILVAGLAMIAFGVLELLGRGFSLVPAAWGARYQGPRSAMAAYGAGLVYGMAGFCSGPVLGAVLAVAATAPSPLQGGALLTTYSIGTAAPLFALAYGWDRYDLGRRTWLRGRWLRLGPLQGHSTNLVGGLLFIVLGASFVLFQGGSLLSGVYADLRLEEVGYALQTWIADHISGIPDGVWLGVAAAAVAAGWVVRRLMLRRRQRPLTL